MDHATWVLTFEAHHRFGIPLDPNVGGTMPISVIKLPAKAGKLEYSEEDQAAALEALASLPAGSGVAVDDPQDTENKARVRARVFAGLIEDRVDDDYRIRVHTVKQESGQGATKRVKYVPALSLAKRKAVTEEAGS